MSWVQAYFGKDYFRLYPDHLDPGPSSREALAAARCLGLSPPARIADLACGFGRHSVPLAEAGYEVVGVDLSDPLLTHARQSAGGAGLADRCRFVHADYRRLSPADLGGPVDGALCLFTSIGYGEPEDDDAMLKSALACLKPGGRLLLDVGNHALVAGLDGRRTWSEHENGKDGWFVLERYRFDRHSRRLEGERVLLDPVAGRSVRYPFSLRSYTQAEIKERLRQAGFQVLAAYGSFERGAFGARSPRLLLLAERPAR